MVPRPGHRDVEQAPLFFDLLRLVGRHVRGNAAIRGVQDIDHIPFLALGGVDRRKDQVVLVEQRRPGVIARRRRGVEGEFGQEALA